MKKLATLLSISALLSFGGALAQTSTSPDGLSALSTQIQRIEALLKLNDDDFNLNATQVEQVLPLLREVRAGVVTSPEVAQVYADQLEAFLSSGQVEEADVQLAKNPDGMVMVGASAPAVGGAGQGGGTAAGAEASAMVPMNPFMTGDIVGVLDATILELTEEVQNTPE